VLFVLGPEPSLRWRSFCAQIIGIAEKVQSPLIIAIGALLADVPHSRPVQLMGVTSDLELMDRFELEPSRYEGPTGIIGVLQAAASETGIPAASLWAAIPGYASQIPSPKAAASLMHRACAILGTPVPRSTLSMEIIAYENRLAAMINDDQELAVYVARLEALADELALSDEEDGPLDSDQLGSPPLVDDPDVLVSEVEKFLRDQKTD
jgi:predicted ATP-grasp superfamily ATP-dependent carboligase